MRRKTLFGAFTIIIMVGCNSSTGSEITQVVSTGSAPVASAPATSDFTPIITFTSSPQAVSTYTPDSGFVSSCLKIEDQEVPLNEIAKQGTVMIGGAIDESPYLLDLQTGLHYNLPFQAKHDTGYFFGFHISPDGNKFAYVEAIENSAKELIEAILWIVNAKGNVITSQVIAPEILLAGFTSTNSWRWLDSTHLEFYFQQTKKDGTVKIFDLSTKVWKSYSNKLPNFYTDFDLERSEWLVEYSPNLDWVIYLGDVNEHGLAQSFGIP